MPTSSDDPKPQWPTEEHWKTLTLHQRWTLVVLTLQAMAAAGTFVAALFGLWTVSPIITYRVQQQQRLQQAAAEAIALPESHPLVARFVQEINTWWQERLGGYERALELLEARRGLGLEVTHELLESVQLEGVEESATDVLVLTATAGDQTVNVVEVPVNENAMPLTQYIQYKINHGAFSGLDEPQRERVEAAVSQYMRFYMVPRVPPPYIGTKMSLDEIEREIRASQRQRVDAAKHILALNAVIEVSLLQ